MALGGCFTVNVLLHSGNGNAIPIVFVCLLGQWAMLQVPLWSLVLGYGLRLVTYHERAVGTTLAKRQFGIRELMIVTAVVAVLLGLGRAFVLNLDVVADWTSQDLLIIGFFAAAAMIMTLPLMLAALLPRFAVFAVLGILILIGAATVWEFPLLTLISRSTGGMKEMDCVWTNVVTAAWVLLFVGAVRLSGYGLSSVAQRLQAEA